MISTGHGLDGNQEELKLKCNCREKKTRVCIIHALLVICQEAEALILITHDSKINPIYTERIELHALLQRGWKKKIKTWKKRDVPNQIALS